MAVKNHNFRFNEDKEVERKAWEILHSREVKEDFRSQNEFVIAAINDYYTRHIAIRNDPYLESREKEDAFVKGIVEAVEKKVLDNLPVTGQVPVSAQGQETIDGDDSREKEFDRTEDDKKYEPELDINEYLDFSFCGE